MQARRLPNRRSPGTVLLIWYRTGSGESHPGRLCQDQPLLHGVSRPSDTATIQEMLRELPVGFHQCAGHSGTKAHEGKLLSWDAAGPFAEPGQLAGKVQRGERAKATVIFPSRRRIRLV